MGYKFVGESAGDNSGISISSAGDVDNDGKADLLIGAFAADDGIAQQNEGAVYLINATDLEALDAADGVADGIISLGNVAAGSKSYEFFGDGADSEAGRWVRFAGDVDNDGKDDFLIGSHFADNGSGGDNDGSTYLINANDLLALDVADGVDGIINLANVAAVGTSYEFVGEGSGDEAGFSASAAGDVDKDGKDDLLISAPFADDGALKDGEGSVYLINGDDLATLDAADGVNGIINLADVAGTASSYKFVGAAAQDGAGYSVSSAGDVDNDGQDDLLISAPFASGSGLIDNGSIYLVLGSELAVLDAVDGSTDGEINLDSVFSNYGTNGAESLRFDGESANFATGWSVSAAGDVDGDNKDDLLIGAPSGSGGQGIVYLVMGNDLSDMVAEDGTPGSVDLSVTGRVGTSYGFSGGSGETAGWSVSSAGDVDNDGKDDLLIGAIGANGGAGATYLINANDLEDLDFADGSIDGYINLSNVAATGTSYRFTGEDLTDQAGYSVSSAGDVDGDGKDDLLVGAPQADDGTPANNEGSTYLIEADRLAHYDGLDGTVDGIIDLGNVKCFHAGTRIATPTGETPVEDLRPGDAILTADGRTVAVKWLARQTVTTRFHGYRAMPVRLRAGALGPGVPHSDLTVTGDHGMVLDGCVVNASALVNDDTIDWVPLRDLPARFTVYHVETARHDVILANGAASESYLDFPDRQGFDNYDEYRALYGDETPVPPLDLPRISSRRLLEATRFARARQTA